MEGARPVPDVAAALIEATGGSPRTFTATVARLETWTGAPVPVELAAAAAAHAAHPDAPRRAEAACTALLVSQGVGAEALARGRHAVAAAAWDGQDPDRRPHDDGAVALWHALVVHRLDPATHLEELAALPLDPEAAAGAVRRYRHHLVQEPHRLVGRLWLPEAEAEAALLLVQLHDLLDALASEQPWRFPRSLELLFEVAEEGEPDPERGAGRPRLPRARLRVPSPAANWRSLLQVTEIEHATKRLAAGHDPEDVKRAAPAPGAAYTAYRDRLRGTIDETQAAILRLSAARIEAARAVAYEKFLEDDTLFKPGREHELLRWVSEQAAEAGLDPSVANDVAVILLTNSRLAQEGVYDRLAAELGRDRKLLNAGAETEQAERARATVPLVASPSPQLLLREHQLVAERRLAGPRATLVALQADGGLHLPPSIATHLLAGSRNLDLTATAHSDRGREALVLLRRDRALHLGHVGLLRTLAAFQRAGHHAVIAVDDLGADPEGDQQDRFDVALADLLARCGVDRAALELRSGAEALRELTEAKGFDGLALDGLVTTFGLPLRTPMRSIVRTLARVSLLAGGGVGPRDRVVVTGLDLDGEVGLAQRVRAAEGDGSLVSALYLRMVRALGPPHDGTAALDDGAVMAGTHNGRPGRLEPGDPPERVAARLATAETGGRASAREQRELGGEPDPRFCSVSSVLAVVATADEHDEVVRTCQSGERLCHDCKARATETLVSWLGRPSR